MELTTISPPLPRPDLPQPEDSRPSPGLTPLRLRLLARSDRGALSALAVDLCAQSACLEDLVRLLADRHWPLAQAVAGLSAAELADDWRWAQQHVAARRAAIAERLSPLDALRGYAASGTQLATDLAVVDGIRALALRHGRLPVAAPVRALAAESGVGRATVARSLARLCSDGWLTKVRPGDTQWAAEYDVGPLALKLGSARAAECDQEPALHLAVDFGADEARRAALGCHALRVWGVLGDTPQSSQDLAGVFGYNLGSVRRWLWRLEAVDLAHRTAPNRGRAPAGWVRGPASPASAARALGTAGRREQERRKAQAWQASRRPRRTKTVPPR